MPVPNITVGAPRVEVILIRYVVICPNRPRMIRLVTTVMLCCSLVRIVAESLT